jgi:hypothetical protein
VICAASSSAECLNAFSIFSRTDCGETRGRTVMLLITDFTPVKLRFARIAASYWYCQSTLPSSVTRPWLTVILIALSGTIASHSMASNAERQIGIVALMSDWQHNIKRIGDGFDTPDSLGTVDRTKLFGITWHFSGQGDHTVLNGHTNFLGMNARLALECFADPVLQVDIFGHTNLLEQNLSCPTRMLTLESPPRAVRSRLGLAWFGSHQDHRNVCVVHYAFGNAAQKQAVETAASMCANHDQARVVFVGKLENLFRSSST